MKALGAWLRGVLFPVAERESRLAQLASIVGPEHVDAALDVAIEAAKMGVRIEDLQPSVQARNFLRNLGTDPRPGQGFIGWALQHGYITKEQIVQAEDLDILGMRDDEPDAPDESTFEQHGDDPSPRS